ncbi:MAG: 3-oxoacyl-ACP reductase [Bacteroidetes bacterium]|nr:MAG: 3-oxoacyl-ACP reductase [Bacteroidota bacterium]
MDISFKEKNVLVTGASRGIGKAAAEMFAEAGANVIVHFNKNENLAKEVINSLQSGNHIKLQADISNPDQVKSLVDKAISKYEKIDILVNNAGVFEESDVMSMSYEYWQQSWTKTIGTNLTGAANLSFLIAKEMKEKGGCKIINVSSRGAFRGEPDAPAYGASKAGMNSFGQSFAKALGKYNIFVYTVAPGFVDTDMTTDAMKGGDADNIKNQSPLKRIAQPEEIARTILYLASDGTEYMTGCIVDINGASYLRT